MKLKHGLLVALAYVLSAQILTNGDCISVLYRNKSGVLRPNPKVDGTQPESSPCECDCRGPRTKYGMCIRCRHMHKRNPNKQFACLLGHKKRSIA